MTRRLITLTLLLPMVVGCFGGTTSDLPELAEVTGAVSLDGSPLEGATITFTPTAGRPSFSGTDENGKYLLQFNADASGAIPGKHSVVISKFKDPEMPGEDLISAKYNQRTTLSADVTKDGPNEINFDLKSK